jgi:uncharacterized protein YecE (DUF72 family)
MEFGRHHNPIDVDYQLKPWESYMASKIPADKMIVYVGGTAWINMGWNGNMYPNNIKKGEELYYYSRQFNSIELNSTYYGIPEVKRVKSWCSAVPEDFRFCPKFPQFISGASKLAFPESQLTEFLNILYAFEEKLGISFFQFPTRMKIEMVIERLNAVLKIIPADIPVMFEIRQSEAYSSDNLLTLVQLLQPKSKGLVITDTAGCRPIIHNVLLTDTIFIRFVSCNVEHLDQMRINHWIDRLSELPSKGVKTVYFFVHEGESNPLPQLALYLSEKIRNIPKYLFRGPQLNDELPEQMTLF